MKELKVNRENIMNPERSERSYRQGKGRRAPDRLKLFTVRGLPGLVLSLALVWTGGAPRAQGYMGQSCVAGKSKLKKQVRAGKISQLHDSDGSVPGDTGWNSSFLAPEGKAPSKKCSGKEETDCWDIQEKYDRWTCAYNSYALRDGKKNTAWSEGAKGAGVGEMVALPVDPIKKYKIWTGFGKSAWHFKANNRPKKVRLYLFEAKRLDVSQVGMLYYKLRQVSQATRTLKDQNGYQDLKLPTLTKKVKERVKNRRSKTGLQAMNHFVLVIEILSVYKGSKYNDTLITEIKTW